MNTLLSNLKSWQRHEWLYRVAWGAARLALVVAVLLSAACFTDWAVDRTRDTPFWLRFLMTAGQLAAYSAAAYYFLVRLGVPSLDALAFRAEEAIPEFDHRIVTALQLNRPGAQTRGMSKDLLAAVTAEAEELSAKHPFTALIDRSRLEWAVALLIPVLLFGAGFVAVRPTLAAVLLARQCLLPVPIPRTLAVTNKTPELWPSGDEVVIRVEVTGPVSEDTPGRVRVEPDDQPAETFPLTFAEQINDTTAIFTAKLPPSSASFWFRAWVGDGRMRSPGRVTFAPRPVVGEVTAWVQLPKYVDPDGNRRYERIQPQGEVDAASDSAVRVEATASKPVAAATVVVYARSEKGGAEKAVARVPMTPSEDRQTVTATFDLPPRASAYRVELVDDNGFGNLNPPRRGISLTGDRPPTVRLLREILKDPLDEGPLDDYEVDQIPLTPNGQVQFAYQASSPLGVGRVYLVYRTGRAPEGEEVAYGPWTFLPLAKTDADPAKVGEFLPEIGAFRKSGATGSVEFYPIPSPDPESEPNGLAAGGRFNFQTAALKKIAADGTESKLLPGDVVQFYVAAADRNPALTRPLTDPDPERDPATGRVPAGRPLGWSEKREKTVVTEDKLRDWLDAKAESRAKLAELEGKQREVFAPKKKDKN